MGEKFAQMNDMKKILKKALFFINKEVLDRLFVVMDYNNKGAITE
jgi:hypothetical protein